jgi:hypothetical protein
MRQADIITGLSASLHTQVTIPDVVSPEPAVLKAVKNCVLFRWTLVASQMTQQCLLLLLLQVVLHLYQEALENVPFFRGQHPQFITSVVTFLKLEYYTPVSAFTSGMAAGGGGCGGGGAAAAAAASVVSATQQNAANVLSLDTANCRCRMRN